MIWTRLELDCWTVGIEFASGFTVHLLFLKVTYIRKGTRLYDDFKMIRRSK